MSEQTEPTGELSRFIVGIDLGTTNCSVAFADTTEPAWTVRDFPVPQLVAPHTVEARELLPSFCYAPAAGEFAEGALRLPWDPRDSWLVGTLARDHGAQVPARLIASAKSWLSHSGIDRTAPLLPWHGAPDVQKLSPVEASARYLGHIRSAWDAAHPEHPLAAQDVVLTVPASFDEVARELTVEAARQAGLVKLTLVEEPQAAFYAWINAQGENWQQQIKPGQKILVIDVGGGTTDLTLINVRPAGKGNVLFHRVAVGEHLILGGDNLDLALAHHVESKATGGGRLPPGQWALLLRTCSRAKETLLGAQAPETLTLSIAGAGAKLIGGARQVELTRQEVIALLVDGFMPRVPLDARPATRRSGFQEFGLPYAPDAGITRYLAAFLSAHRDPTDSAAARPDVVLFNGGLFNSPLLRERAVQVISSWFPGEMARKWKPKLLKNDRLDLAVSRGAAYYGMVRRGRGVRITGGLAHSYYVGVEADGAEGRAAERAVCLLPAGVEEGHEVNLGRTFALRIRQPVEFPLYVSATRTTDAPGTLLEADAEQLTALPPIRTVLQSGRKSAADVVGVNLHARLTAIGTLELWAQEARGDRQWKLQFDVRSATRAEVGRHTGQAETQGFVESHLITPAQGLIREAFSPRGGAPAPHHRAAPSPPSLVKRLELATAMSRWDWPASLMRSLWEALMDVQDGRRLSPEHEARWLNLTGFCLRPGYGLAVDDWRVAQVWRLQAQKLAYPRNEQCRAEWWILWRRLAGGLTAGQQLTLAEPLIAALRSRLRPAGPIAQPRSSPFQYGPHESAEAWRLLGSLELLKLPVKLEIGQVILELLPREKHQPVAQASLFALGRLGQRVPVYGPLNCLLAPDVAEQWARRVMETFPGLAPGLRDQALFCLVQLTRRSGDRYRDIDDQIRQQVIEFLSSHAAGGHYLELVERGGSLEAQEQDLAIGESLPRGLRIE